MLISSASEITFIEKHVTPTDTFELHAIQHVRPPPPPQSLLNYIFMTSNEIFT